MWGGIYMNATGWGSYRIEGVVLLEGLLEDGGLLLGEAELLPGRGVAVVVDLEGAGGSLAVVLLPLAPLPAQGGDSAVGGGDHHLLVAVDHRYRSVHIDPSEHRSRLRIGI